MLNLPKWILQRQDERFLQALIETRAEIDVVTEKQVLKILRVMRYKRAVAPYVYIFKLVWEDLRGRYRTALKKNNGDPNASPGGSPGAAGQPVAQFTGPAGITGNAFQSFAAAGASGVTMPSPNPGTAFEDAGIVAGEVVAYRCWKLKSDGLLYSVYRDCFCWKPGEIIEGDAANGDGVHAFKSLILMCQYAGSPQGYVTGTVDLWGDVYEHERGYRASKAAIRTIDSSPDYDAKALRKLYGLNKRKAKKPT